MTCRPIFGWAVRLNIFFSSSMDKVINQSSRSHGNSQEDKTFSVMRACHVIKRDKVMVGKNADLNWKLKISNRAVGVTLSEVFLVKLVSISLVVIFLVCTINKMTV